MSSAVRDLGIMIDSDISMRSHVSGTVSGCSAVLHHICSVQRSVSVSVFTSLAMSLIVPHLHYGNATLAGRPEYQHHRLQSVLNAAARLIYQKVDANASHLFCESFTDQVRFKLAVLMYRCLHGTAPSYTHSRSYWSSTPAVCHPAKVGCTRAID